MVDDPIVAEVRRAKERIAERCDYNIGKLVAALRKKQEKNKRMVVSLPRRPVNP